MATRDLHRLLGGLLLTAAACGGRIAPDDAGADPPASSPSPAPAPRRSGSPSSPGKCYGAVTAVHDANCSELHTPSGESCSAALTCNGHLLTMRCEDGFCTCDNPGVNSCTCEVPEGLIDPCGKGNCCWL